MYCIRKLIILVVLIATYLTLLLQNVTLACGTIKMWSATYENGAHHKALFHMMDCADSYKAPSDDFVLLPIIKDALERDEKVSRQAVEVFKLYNHLWGAREDTEFAKVFKTVTGISDYKKVDKYDSWYIVTARNGANMRDKPSLGGKIITAVKYGMQVSVSQNKGEWMHAIPVGPGAIDPRFEGKKGYIHHSILHPY
jgi:hypothetical protein